MDTERTSLDRRALLRRMAAGGAVVWATPMMQSIASAQGVPSCTVIPRVVDWDLFPVGTLFTSTTVAGTTVSLAVSNVINTTLLANNQRVLAGPAGNINQRHLRFEMTPTNSTVANGSRQTITITFSRAVTGVSFTFFDIDNVTGAWGDRIVMLTPGYTFTTPVGGTVIGLGTDANRFRNSQANNNLPPTSNAGNLTVTYAGPLTTIAFTYRNEVSANNNNQLISISDINFLC